MMRNSRWYVTGAIALAATAGITFVALRSGVTQLASVQVVGAESLDPAAVRRASGLRPGMHAFTLDLGAAERRVERLPLVQDAEVARDGAFDVVIRIRERAAQLLVRSPLGRRALDATGTQVALPADPRGLPVVEVAGFDEVTPEVAADALRLWSALTGSEQRRAGISWGARGFTVSFGEREIRLGTGEQIRAKLATVRALRGQLPRGASRVDVSSLPRIAVA